MWYERGRSSGSNLEQRTAGLDAVRSQTEAEIRQQISQKQGQLAPLEARLVRRRMRIEVLDSLLQRLRAERLRLDLERDGLSSDYSFAKGLIYVGLAAVLILADVSLLGQVTARFLMYPWYQGDQSFAQVIFSDPRAALEKFPDLLFLVMSVLLLGLFVKVWRDVENADPDAAESGRLRDRFMYRVLLVCALFSVLLMSAARLTMAFGQEIQVQSHGSSVEPGITFPGVVAFVLGFSLPLVSAGFFVRGYDVLEKRYRLFRVSRRLQFNEWLRRMLDKGDELLEQRIGELREAIRLLESSSYLEETVRTHWQEFGRGYDSAIRELFSSGRLVDHLKPIAISRAMNRGAR